MSLVAYDNSDESGESDSDSNDVTNAIEASSNLTNICSEGSDLLNHNVNNVIVNTEHDDNKSDNVIPNEPDISDDDEFLVSESEVSGLCLPPPVNNISSITPNTFTHSSQLENSSSSLLGLPAPKLAVTELTRGKESDELDELVKPKAAELAQGQKPPDKKKKKIITISASSLTEFDSDSDDEEPDKKKSKPSATGSGLFALLPKPKNTSMKEAGRALIPHTLSKKPKEKSAKPLANPLRTKTTSIAATNDEEEEEEEEEEEVKNANFFSFGSASAEKEPSLLSSSSYSVISSTSTLPGVTHKSETVSAISSESEGFVGPSVPEHHQTMEQYQNQYHNMVNQEYVAASDEVEQGAIPADELLRLQGRRNRGREDLNIIDVFADHQTNTLELTKNMTEEVDLHTHSKKNKDVPSSQQKRKHQITYLAHKAKEREFDLKNQWAQNKMTKQQTQSKYGF